MVRLNGSMLTGHLFDCQIGNYLYQKAAGYSSLADDAQPITLESTWFIASCTKVVTAIAVLQCVERGLITLDEPIDKWLPELAAQPVISVNEGEDKNTKPLLSSTPKTKITLRQLLTHSSGAAIDMIPNPAMQIWLKIQKKSPGFFNPNLLESIDRPLVFEPGTQWMYGPGHEWAGLLISRLNGNISLEKHFEQNIYQPLKLTSTTFHLDQKPQVREKLVAMTARTAEGGLQPAVSPFPDPSEAKGGGGLYTSVRDYMAILADIIKDSPVLLKKESADLLFSPQLAPDSGPVDHMYKNDIHFSTSTGGSVRAMGVKINHGLGGVLYEDYVPSSGSPPGTIGWGGIPNSLWWANRNTGVAGFIVYAHLPSADQKATQLSLQFQKAFWKLVQR